MQVALTYIIVFSALFSLFSHSRSAYTSHAYEYLFRIYLHMTSGYFTSLQLQWDLSILVFLLIVSVIYVVSFHLFQDWGQPVNTAMDSLTAALKSNIIPNQEYLLQGSVLDAAVEVLLHRLRGLCDNVDSGPETFHDHEMCFSIRKLKFHLNNLYSSQHSCSYLIESHSVFFNQRGRLKN